jgi:putative acyl-CoA dehydrogenase
MEQRFETHEVTNQPPPLVDVDFFGSDPALKEAVLREGASWAEAELQALGRKAGSEAVLALGPLANAHPPVLRAFDRQGRRQDRVEFHPAWHQLLSILCEEGVHASPWAEPKPGAQVARAAKYLMLGRVEAGSLCPVTMTFGSVPALRRDPEIAAEWLPKVLSRRYDPSFRPAAEKTGCLIGMGMTEKQGGSDVRANQTRAEPVPGTERAYTLVGHKWFLSAPMCDAFLVTAQAPGGLACFFVPRWTPAGDLNALRLQRLKDKLGNRSNASSEVEFHGAWGLRLGEEGRGIPTIIEMATYTRLDCALGTTALMRQAVAEAAHHARHRLAFQKRLIDQPLMRNVLADLALEVEAAIALVFRLARAFDAEDDPREAALRRLLTPAAKYWICKRGPMLAAEAMEVLGGNGYVEDHGLARIYREMPVNSIWEGSGNVMALDMLRAAGRSPDALDAFRGELARAQGGNAVLDRFVASLEAEMTDRRDAESRARRLAERLVLAVQGALLVRYAPAAVADAFCTSRLSGESGRAFGALPTGLDLGPIVERAG